MPDPEKVTYRVRELVVATGSSRSTIWSLIKRGELPPFKLHGVLLGSGKLAAELDRLDLIDEYKLLVHPRIAGHGPTLYGSGLPGTRRLELISAQPLRNGAVAMHYRRAG